MPLKVHVLYRCVSHVSTMEENEDKSKDDWRRLGLCFGLYWKIMNPMSQWNHSARPKPGQAKPKPRYWLGLVYFQAKATLSRAKATAFRPSQSQNITISNIRVWILDADSLALKVAFRVAFNAGGMTANILEQATRQMHQLYVVPHTILLCVLQGFFHRFNRNFNPTEFDRWTLLIGGVNNSGGCDQAPDNIAILWDEGQRSDENRDRYWVPHRVKKYTRIVSKVKLYARTHFPLDNSSRPMHCGSNSENPNSVLLDRTRYGIRVMWMDPVPELTPIDTRFGTGPGALIAELKRV
ncbi:hypothetical protein K438DRAFT_1773225 [Mycena galopus ATCC 62051]|nr:hypothetical protein K438DRAFT_1773225 [Mycena galopus ATCC 62051]